MIIAINIDDVVADTTPVVLGYYNRYAFANHTQDEITSWEIDFHEDGFPLTLKNFYNDPILYDKVRPVKGALRAVYELLDRGHRVVYATACMSQTRGKKQEWLHKHEFLGKHIRKDWWMDYIEVADKSLVRADVLIDDGYHNILGFNGLGILWDRPWNRNVHPNFRADSWEKVLGYIGKPIGRPL